LVIDQDRLFDAAEPDAVEALEGDPVNGALVDADAQLPLQGAHQLAVHGFTAFKYTDTHVMGRGAPPGLDSARLLVRGHGLTLGGCSTTIVEVSDLPWVGHRRFAGDILVVPVPA
jgi:hypothetical protein